ncbi:DUF1510 family protein [Bacillus salacetis]|uniref:DUF1510 family protein n=1 Tax=Bacillus salacetis TaxID=2315464 RepID=A0A3A1R5G7_9BACI|nr:DUF1510 family protein [Bacillus salacetis]RIW37627.1 DUF1510 family protein [Bacillus salacetis]
MPKYNSRLDKRAKKKSNVVLNSLIGVVLLLIAIVGATIFLGNDNEPAAGDNAESPSNEVADSSSSNEEEETEEPAADTSTDENEEAEDEESSNENGSETGTDSEDADEDKPVADGEALAEDEDKDKKEEKEKENKKEEKESSDDKKKIVKESDAPNVKKEIVNPAWKPIGTQQTGEHVAKYEEDSADWQEKVQALSYATGLPEDNMTVWWLERNGGPDKAIGTVAPKDQSTTYRVYLQWVDGKGWKPVKMEELIENDKD